jgi:hypothetical protein
VHFDVLLTRRAWRASVRVGARKACPALVEVGDYLAARALDEVNGGLNLVLGETPGKQSIAFECLAGMREWRYGHVGMVKLTLDQVARN